MGTPEPTGIRDLRLDVANLYKEENFTDLRVASIRRLTPVLPDGSVDSTRETRSVVQTNVMTPAGPVPLECPIEAKTLPEAIEKLPEALQEGVAQFMEEVKEMQRRAASRIVVPTPGGTLGGSGGPNIQLP